MLSNVCFVELEQVNICLRKLDVSSLKLFDSLYLFLVIASGEMVTSFIRYLFKQIWFETNEKRKTNFKFVFQVQLFQKSKNHLILCFMSQL